MKIIGHRGAAGLAPENSIAAIQAGIKAGADAVEFDVRRTSDGHFVLVHDISMLRAAGTNLAVNEATLKDLQRLELFSGEPLATLEEALKAATDVTAVIEAKGTEWAEPLAEFLKGRQEGRKICVISFHHQELVRFHSLMHDVPCYVIERQNALKMIRFARQQHLKGVDLNFWILNPFSYLYARLLGLKVITYTVDHPLLMRFFKTFYPHAAITTNRPDILKQLGY